MINFIRNYLIRRASARFALALADELLPHEDVPQEVTEAERWVELCRASSGAERLIHDPVARSSLAQAAVWHQTIGYCGRIYGFADSSQLVLNENGEVVL